MVLMYNSKTKTEKSMLFIGLSVTDASENRPAAIWGSEESDEESFEGSAEELRQAFDRLFSINTSDNQEATKSHTFCHEVLPGENSTKPPKSRKCSAGQDRSLDRMALKRAKTTL
jgi:hypothetical protein